MQTRAPSAPILGVQPASDNRSCRSDLLHHCRHLLSRHRARFGNLKLWMGGFDQRSSASMTSSNNFSPGRKPVYSMRTVSSVKPDKPNDVARKFGDAYWLAHIENINSPTFAHRCCLQHQLRCFRNRHEISRHVRMSHRHRAAARHLLLKLRYDATGAPRTLPNLTTIIAVSDGSRLQPLANHFRKTFRRAHYVGRPDCLVG